MLLGLGTDDKNMHIFRTNVIQKQANSFHLSRLNPRLQRAKRGMCGFRTHYEMNKEITWNATNLL